MFGSCKGLTGYDGSVARRGAVGRWPSPIIDMTLPTIAADDGEADAADPEQRPVRGEDGDRRR